MLRCTTVNLVPGDNDILPDALCLQASVSATPHIVGSESFDERKASRQKEGILIIKKALTKQPKMRRGIAGLTAGAAMVHSAAAIMVSTDSTCDQQCGNVLDATTPADIVCNQNDYTSAAGVVFENCLNCEISSTAYDTSTNQSDQQWALYNSRYALSECLFGQPGNNNAYLGGTPCVTS